jgi:hypothetical protein
MKSNTEQVKTLLSQAMRNVPDDFALAEVRVAIRNALTKLENVEAKRERRDRQDQQATNQWPVVNGQVINPYAVKQTIDLIDEMIASEKKKIEEIHNRRKTKHDGEDEDLQTVFG